MRAADLWAAIATLVVLLTAGCSRQDVLEALEGAPPLTVSDRRASVPVTDVLRIELDAAFPTDLRPTGDGGFVVLDGGRRTLTTHDAAGRELGRIQGPGAWGAPARFVADGDGWLLADPGPIGDPGAGPDRDPGGLVRIGPEGTVRGVLSVVRAPVALVFDGDGLTVAGREGGLVRCDPQGERCAQVPLPSGEGGDRVFTDLALLGDGVLAAVDPLSSSVHLLVDGVLDHSFGRFGRRVGALQQPKAVAPVDGALLIVDSALGTVEVFERSGIPLGPLLTDGELLRWDHPVAVRALGGDRIAVLDAASRSVTLLSLSSADLEDARAHSDLTRLRLSFPARARDEASRCRQCHDGLIQEGRAHEDPSRFAHPVDVLPEGPLPEGVVLDAQGRLVCASCHSPHGEAPASRIPHGSEDFLARADRSALCTSCHDPSAHGGMVTPEVVQGGARRGHLVGAALTDALARRPRAADGGAGPRGDCLDCHAAHGAGSESLLRTADLGGTCVGCHEDHRSPARNHPLGAAFAKGTPRPGASARVQLDEHAGIGCGTCHDVLEGAGHALLRPGARGAPICLSCHTTRRPAADGPHGRLDGHGGPACLACHDPHGSSRADHLPAPATGGEGGCLSCHGPGGRAGRSGAAPGTRGHPVTGVGDAARAVDGCLTCHDAHDPGPAPACASCHVPQGEAASRGGHGTAECMDCHPVHGDAPKPPRAAAAENPASRPCLACHAPESTRATPIATAEHPMQVFLPDGSRWGALAELPLFDAEGAPAPEGVNGSLTCQSCHRVHGPEPGDKAGLLRPRGMEPCAACHGADALPLFRWFHDPVRRARVVGGATP